MFCSAVCVLCVDCKEDSASPYKMDTAEEGKQSRHGGIVAAVCLLVVDF